MDPRRLRAGDWILGAGSLLLLISLFSGWYEAQTIYSSARNPSGDYTLTAFEAFSAIDLILAAGALYGLALVVVSAMQNVSAVNVAGATMAVYLAAALLVVVLFRAARIPDFELDGGTVFEAGRDTGIWLALAGSLTMLGGALASIRDERITGDTRTVDPADIEASPAPPGATASP